MKALSKVWLIISSILVLILITGAMMYFSKAMLETATVSTMAESIEITPELTYSGAYNDKLYLTGEKTGSEAPFDQLVENMDRNGVATSIAYFGIEADNKLIATDNVNTITQTLRDYPGRFVAFYSPGFGSDEVAEIVGPELLEIFQVGFETGQKAAPGMLRGIGEIEMQVWQQRLDSPEVTSLLQFASDNKLPAMVHIKPAQVEQFDALIKDFPNTVFLLHLFPNDLEQIKDKIVELLRNNQNLTYTIDADHMMFDRSSNPPIGLLYKYQNESAKSGAEKFNQDFDQKFESLLAQATERFSPLVAAAPDRVTIGTEASTDYSFEPAVYDRSIKLIRHFIAKQDPAAQENIAYKNAERIFGLGTVLE